MSVPNVLKTEVLKEEFMYLCDELGDPSRYFPHLRSKSLIDGKDCERIRSKVVSSEKTEELLNTLLSRKDAHGEHPLDVLISDLKKQRVQVHIARRLQRTLKKKTQTVETTNGVCVSVWVCVCDSCLVRFMSTGLVKHRFTGGMKLTI